MGVLVWAVTTLAVFGTATLVVHRGWPDRSGLERAALSVALGMLTQVGILTLLGAVQLLYRPAVVLATGALVVFCLRTVGRDGVSDAALSLSLDVREALRALNPLRAFHDPLILVAPLALAVFLLGLTSVWLLNTWNYDASVYHVPIALHTQQNHGLGWIETHSMWTKGYPVNGSLLIVWNTILTGDKRLDDASQIVPTVAVMLVVAAWARRLGASRQLALAVGLCLFTAPAIIVQMPHPQNDIVCAAFLMVTLYLSSFEWEQHDRLVAMAALGAYVGTKYSGVIHTAFLVPWLLFRTWRTPVKKLVLPAVLFLGFGIYKYVENILKTGNPTWPFHLNLPFGLRREGLLDAGPFYFAPPGSSGLFFGAPGDLQRLLDSWYELNPVLWPDVRTGGFGPFFAFVALPCVVLTVVGLVWTRRWRWLLPMLLGIVSTVVLPAAWWARYTLAVLAVSLVATGWFFGALGGSDRRWIRAIGKVLAVLAVGVGGYAVGRTMYMHLIHRDFYGWFQHLHDAALESPELRTSHQASAWTWAPEMHQRRTREVKPGEIVAYDRCGDFLSEFFDFELERPVVHMNSDDPPAFVTALRTVKPRWIGVIPGSSADRLLTVAGGTPLFVTPTAPCKMFGLTQQNFDALDVRVLGP